MELRFEKLCKSYGTKQALRDFSLTLTPGIYGLLGPNGAGKSTLMNILTGNLAASDGQIFFDGQDITTLGQDFRARVGYCPQQQTFYPGFTAEQFLFYMASLHGMKKSQALVRIDSLLTQLSLQEVRYKAVRTLSGGMKQRLLLGQALLHDPDILILDEPTAGLDPQQRIAVRNLVGQIALHKIVLISTHVVPDVEYIAKELILLLDGSILCHDTPGALLRELEGLVWEVLTTEERLPQMETYGTVCGINREDDGVLVRLLCQEAPPPCGKAVRPTLEDVYLRFFKGAEGL
jgi:ABC-2 type transport system ATP-binding protein